MTTTANFVRDKIRATVNDPATAETLSEEYHRRERALRRYRLLQTYNRENVELIDVGEKPVEAITPSGIRAHGNRASNRCLGNRDWL